MSQDNIFKFLGGNGKQEDCNCDWCKLIEPTYQRLIGLINENVGVSNQGETLKTISNLKLHHSMVYTECEIYKENIKLIIQPGRN
jgi:hypothetical protein